MLLMELQRFGDKYAVRGFITRNACRLIGIRLKKARRRTSGWFWACSWRLVIKHIGCVESNVVGVWQEAALVCFICLSLHLESWKSSDRRSVAGTRTLAVSNTIQDL